jgi:MFS transporter, ACS family, D-galactonate transporter
MGGELDSLPAPGASPVWPGALRAPHSRLRRARSPRSFRGPSIRKWFDRRGRPTVSLMQSVPPPTLENPRRMLLSTSILLFLSVVICYIDRSNLSVAAPLLKDEFGFSPSRLGTLLSAFFWSYAAFQLVSGWLVDRYDVNWVMAAGFFLWSAATAATGLAGGFGTLLAMRLVVGFAESVAYPAYSKIFATHYTEGQRGLANSLIDVGCKCGPALGTLAGGFYMARFGWRPFFFILGLGALPWLPCWIKWMPRGRGRKEKAPAAGPTVGEILGKRAAWATFAGLFCGNYYWYFLLTWLPYYLVRERHFSMGSMAVAGSVPLICCAAATTVAGWLSYRALESGATPTRVRKTCTVAGLGCSAVIVAVPVIADAKAAVVVLMIACASYGVYSSSPWAITQTLAGPLAAGRWSGLKNFVGNLSGMVAPALTGVVVDRTGQFFWAFALTAFIALSGAAVYLFGLGKVEPATWRYQAAR